MKQKKFIRIMALILCLVMVLGMIPVFAHAEEAPVYAGSAYTTEAPLPDIVLDDLEASGTGLGNVYDFAAYNSYNTPGSYENYGVEAKADPASQYGKAWTFNAWHRSDNTPHLSTDGFGPGYCGTGGVHLRSSKGWKILNSIYTGDIIQDGVYHWYKRTITVGTDGVGAFLFPFDWSSNPAKIGAAIDSYMKNSTVDVYIRMKIEGNISNTTDPTKGPIWYLDRFVLVKQCAAHHATENWTVIEGANCGHGILEGTTCASCGGIKTRESGDPVGVHNYSNYTWNAESMTYSKVCSVCNEKVKSKTFAAQLPQTVVDDLSASGIGLDHVLDVPVNADTYKNASGNVTSFVADATATLGKTAVMDLTKCANPGGSVTSLNYAGAVISASEFVTDNQWHTYKLANYTMPASLGNYVEFNCGSQYCYLRSSNPGIGTYNALRNHIVDIYISYKISGPMVSNNPPKFYIDRVMFVDSCVNYVDESSFSEPTAATCTEPSYRAAVCSGCGGTYKKVVAPALGHKFGSYQYNPATGMNVATCSTCGETVSELPDTLEAPLPEEVRKDLETSGVGTAHVVDLPVNSSTFFNASGTVVSFLDNDTTSHMGKSAVMDAYQTSEVGQAVLALRFLGAIIPTEEMVVDGQWHFYKMADFVMPASSSRYEFNTGLNQVRYANLRAKDATSANLLSHTVDIYISYKIVDGRPDADEFKYYIDRVIFVDGCENHIAENAVWTDPTVATCTEPSTKSTLCSVCGNTYKKVVAPALGHDTTSHVYDPALGRYIANCKREGCSGSGIYEEIYAKLPVEVLANINATDSGLTHVFDYNAEDMDLHDVFTEEEDSASLLGKAARVRARDAANPSNYIMKSHETWPIVMYSSAGNTEVGIMTYDMLKPYENKGYQIYVFEDVTIPEGGFTYLQTFNYNLQNHQIAKDLAPFAGKKMDFYLSMKIDGILENDMSKDLYPIYYVDRMIAVLPCEGNDCVDYIPQVYDVTYDANGGTGTIAAEKVEEGSIYTLPRCTFTAAEGTSFLNWRINGKDYQPGDSFYPDDDFIVRARWETKTADEEYFKTFEPVLRFIVTSDTHVNFDSHNRAEEQRLERFLEASYEYAATQDYKTVDGAFVVGDLSETGSEDGHKYFFNVFNSHLREETVGYAAMGNHENDYDKGAVKPAVDRYLQMSGYKSTEFHSVINGYHFILMGPVAESCEGYSEEQMAWLKEKLDEAVADDPTGTKPIFVFQHHPAYGTLPASNGTAGKKNVDAVLSNYPQVVDFAGHTHHPTADPRSVWQGEYTAIGTGTLNYNSSELVGQSGSFKEADREGGYTRYCSMRTGGVYNIVEVDANNAIRVRRYDINSEKMMDEDVCIRSVGDPDDFTYIHKELEAASEVPYFSNDDTVEIETLKSTMVRLRFSQAECKDNVQYYIAELYQGATKVASEIRLSLTYHYDAPETLTAPFRGLTPSTEYTAKIYAVSSWGKKSEPKVFTFTTTDGTDETDDVFKLGFDANGNPINTVNGLKLIKFDEPVVEDGENGKVLANLVNNTVNRGGFKAERMFDYYDAMTDAVTFEVFVNYFDFASISHGSSIPLGDRVSGGAAIEVTNTALPKFGAYINGTYVEAAAANKLTANEYHHLVGTYDGQTIRLYVNGVEVASKAAVGKITWPGSETASAHYLGVTCNARYEGWASHSIRGRISRAAVYGSAMTAEEVQAAYQEALGKHICVFDRNVVKTDALKSEADCDNAAVYYKSCSCGAISTTETFFYGSAKGHTPGDWQKNDDEHWQVCGVCSDEIANSRGKHADNDGNYACDSCGYDMTPEHVCEFNQEIPKANALKSEADCNNAAVYYKSCSCGAISTTETFFYGSAKGHTPGDWQKNDDEHWQVCGVCSDEIANSRGKHADNDGNYACDSCGYDMTPEHVCEFNQEIPKANALKSEADCDNAAVYYKSCSCGAISTTDTFFYGSAKGHTPGDWQKNDDEHWQVCGVCSDEIANSRGKHADNDGNYACDSCGYDMTPEHVCEFNQEIPKANALKSEADCDNAAVYYKSCSCGAISTTETFTYGSPAGHVPSAWVSNNSRHWQICTVCRETITSSVGSHIDRNNDNYCDICRYRYENNNSFWPGFNTELSIPVPQVPFVDVAATDWFYDSVVYVYENGLMNGTDRSTFDPHGTTSRAMIVTILWRLEGQPEPKTASTFSDVAAGSYYAKAIAWAAENGIVNGINKTVFDPNGEITREQMASILWRYAKYAGMDVSVGEDTNILSYNDVSAVSEYAIPAIQWACGAGILSGKGGGYLDPAGQTTRAEAAAILTRYCS